MMISDDDLRNAKGLPPLQQFSVLEQIANSKLEAALSLAGPDQRPQYNVGDYVSTVFPLAQVCEIEELATYPLVSVIAPNYNQDCLQFRSAARMISMRARYAAALTRMDDPDTVAFDPAVRELLRFHLRQIIETVDKLEVTEHKRDRLYDAISKLGREIERIRTPLASGLALLAELSEGAEPLLNTAQKVVSIFFGAKDDEEDRHELTRLLEKIGKGDTDTVSSGRRRVRRSIASATCPPPQVQPRGAS